MSSKWLSLLRSALWGSLGSPNAERHVGADPDGSSGNKSRIELDAEFLASHAEQLARDLNEALRRANEAVVPAKRRSQLLIARERLGKLKGLSEWNPSLKLENLSAVEQSIVDVEKETDELDPPREPGDFLKRPLVEQCRTLGIPLERLELERAGKEWRYKDRLHSRPELAALAYYQAQGFRGTSCEGTTLLMLMKCACLDYLARVNTFGSRADACTRYFEAQCQIHSDRAGDIIGEVGSANESTIRHNLREILAQPSYSTLYAPLSEEAMVAIWKALTPGGLSKLTERLLEDPGRRAGWPDLTLARGSELLFIEVKTTDRLHASQRALIQDVLIPFGADVRVIQLCGRRP